VGADRLGRALAHDPSALHDRDPVREAAHRLQVVADEQITQAQPLLQLDQQLEDLGAQRRIQSRGRLVQHEQPRLARQRPRDVHALALTARQLMRIPLSQFRIQAGEPEQLPHPRRSLGGIPAALHPQRFGDGLTCGQPGTE